MVNGKKAVPLNRVPIGSEFWSCGRKLVLTHWHDCGASVNESGTLKRVSLTDRYGNEREFVARSQKSTRIAAHIVVEVDEGATLLEFNNQHGMNDLITHVEWERAIGLDERMKAGTLRAAE